MNHQVSTQTPLRRVGAIEGAGHIAVAAVIFAGLARPLDGVWLVLLPLAGGVFWSGCYAAFRAAKLRDWFGAWDMVSFATVVSYSTVLALTLVGALNRWV